MPQAYVVNVMGAKSQEGSDFGRDPKDMRGLHDWRAAISAPLTYRIGSSTLHFRSHLLFVSSIVSVAVLTIAYLTVTGRNKSNFDHSLVGEHSYRKKYNHLYPLTPAHRKGGTTTYRIAVVEDPDTGSRRGQDNLWVSSLKYGYLTITDPPVQTASLIWDQEDVSLSSSLSTGGRGMELSELVVFNGGLITVDDRTGVVYRIEDGKVIPWVILSDGDGSKTKGFKAEWSSMKEGELWVGGLGKEWTTQQGELANYDPMWVKVIGVGGQVQHRDWTHNYLAVRAAVGVVWPGYMIHEAVCWSPVRRRWVFLPRRVGKERYNDVVDERMGTNLLITANEEFSDIQVSHVGPLQPTHGFSSFKFIPDSKDEILVALKSEEVEGKVSTYMTVITMEGRVLMEETRIGDKKYEGIEFV